MPKTPPAALAAAIARDRRAAPEDKLQVIRENLRVARDKQRQKDDADELSRRLGRELYELGHKTLPDLFTEAGIDNLGLPAEGNLPAYDTPLQPWYKANILAEWPPERRAAAFQCLDDRGAGDLIKSTYTVLLPRGERDLAIKVRAALEALGVPVEESLSVPWNTLTAYVKEQIEKHNDTPPLDVLGAEVGQVVKLNQRKEK